MVKPCKTEFTSSKSLSSNTGALHLSLPCFCYFTKPHPQLTGRLPFPHLVGLSLVLLGFSQSAGGLVVLGNGILNVGLDFLRDWSDIWSSLGRFAALHFATKNGLQTSVSWRWKATGSRVGLQIYQQRALCLKSIKSPHRRAYDDQSGTK